MKLFLFPYAGGSTIAYRQLCSLLNETIEAHPFEYKGRARRCSEAYYKDIQEGVSDAFAFIKEYIKDETEEYAMFGHSMGGLFVYEILRKIEEEGIKYPTHVFLSSRRAPHIKRAESKKYYLLPEDEFIKSLEEIGGLEKELLETKEFREYYLPIIRSDYKLVEEYKNQVTSTRIDCNLTILYAENDVEVEKKDVLAWQQYGNKKIETYQFEDGHFYFKEDASELANIINNTLLRYGNV